MGYTTDFYGQFKFNKPLDNELKTFLTNFAETRRMHRDVEIIKEIYSDWQKYCFKGDLGFEGGYFARPDNNFGQTEDKSIVSYNNAPTKQPGLWCQWIPTADGTALEWDGGEKFYHYIEWLRYLIKNFIAPSEYLLNGQVRWQGESSGDRGLIIVENNEVFVE